MRASFLTCVNYLQAVVAPAIARHVGWLYWPLAALCRRFDIRFLINMPAGMGHNTVELDRYFRAVALRQIDQGLRVVLFRYPNVMHRESARLYKGHFWWTPTSRLVFLMLLPLTLRYRDITLDGGMSRLKWQLRQDLSYDRPVEGQTYLYQIPKEAGLENWRSYYRLRAQTPEIFPLSEGIEADPELISFLGGSVERLALFHIKLGLSNATGAATTAEEYLPAMEFLRAEGYQLVFVGREEMPAEFEALGVLNYAESPVASYRHDLQIFKLASIAVTAGSGIAFLPDCMNIPYVYADSWHIGMPMFSQRCVIVPALVRERQTGRVLTFAEQAELYWSMPDTGHESFPSHRFEACNASGDEILEGVKEALRLGKQIPPRSELQNLYAKTDEKGLLPLSQARASDYFLAKHERLLAQPSERSGTDSDPERALTIVVATDSARPAQAPGAAQRLAVKIAPKSGASIPLWKRLRLIPHKLRERGVGWALGRISQITGLETIWTPLFHSLFSLLGLSEHNRDILYVYYDLDLYPISYDVAYFLVNADLERRRLRLSKLHVLFVRLTAEEYGDHVSGVTPIVDYYSRSWRFRNIACPLPSLLSATSGITVCASRAQARTLLVHAKHTFPALESTLWRRENLPAIYRAVVTDLRLGTADVGLRATEQGLRYVHQWIASHAKGRKLVVITLRQYLVDPERNNDLDAWLAFARGLPADTYAPVFIPDTDHVFDDNRKRLDEFLVFEAAAWNIELRMAIYEAAYLNLLVNAGTAALCVLNGRCRYLMFKILVPNVHLASEKVLTNQGFMIGETPPFVTQFQKWVWEMDREDIIRREFDAMCRQIEASQHEEPAVAPSAGKAS